MRKGKLVLTPLPLQAIYTTAQVAKAIGIDRRRLQRLLKKWNIVTLAAGADIWVPMSELEGKLEPLWDSILAAARADRQIARGRKART